jgi:hypothetical protein
MCVPRFFYSNPPIIFARNKLNQNASKNTRYQRSKKELHVTLRSFCYSYGSYLVDV